MPLPDAQRHLWRPEDYFSERRIAEIFPDSTSAPLEIDLGSGDGSFLVDMATRFPERNFLGVERLLGRVRKTALKAARGSRPDGSLLDNVRVARLDSGYLAGWLLEDDSVDRFHLLCPDPWPKKKHHKNRFVRQEDFHRGLGRKLKIGGEVCFKTDDQEYFEDGLEQLDALSFLERIEWPKGFYATTDFERQWGEMGRELKTAAWRRVS